VPVLELDPGGLGRLYGVGLGLTVLLTNDNGAEFPIVPQLGRVATGHDHINSQGELAALAEHRGRQLQLVNSGDTTLVLKPQGDKSACDWFGEVIDHKLDGTLVIRLANGLVVDKQPKQLYILNDPMMEMEGFEHIPDQGPDFENQYAQDHDAFHMHGHGGIANEFAQMFGYHGYAPFDPDGMSIDGDGNERVSVIEGDGSVGDGEGWETVSEEDNGARTGWGDDSGMDVDEEDSESARDEAEVRDMVLEPLPRLHRPATVGRSAENTGEPSANGSGLAESRSDETIRGDVEVNSLAAPAAAAQVNGGNQGSLHVNAEAGPSSATYDAATTEEDGWDRFEMLDEAPAEHHYYDKEHAAGNRAYMNRVQKEHRALMTSLPGKSACFAMPISG
jgi:ubiquitin-conjugating enzyme E2 O